MSPYPTLLKLPPGAPGVEWPVAARPFTTHASLLHNIKPSLSLKTKSLRRTRTSPSADCAVQMRNMMEQPHQRVQAVLHSSAEALVNTAVLEIATNRQWVSVGCVWSICCCGSLTFPEARRANLWHIPTLCWSAHSVYRRFIYSDLVSWELVNHLSSTFELLPKSVHPRNAKGVVAASRRSDLQLELASAGCTVDIEAADKLFFSTMSTPASLRKAL